MIEVIFDVGANNGSDSIRYAKKYCTTVHCFEPAPRMIAELTRHLATGHDLTIVPKAVSNFDGEAEFNIDENGDNGCSSLMAFVDGLETTWPSRHDLKMTGRIVVPVTRLDTYMLANGIDLVRYLHVDAQGADLHVLEGLGDLHDRVEAGVVEAATDREGALYIDQPLLVDIEAWLEEHNFAIVGRSSNDPWNHEWNVRFERR